MKHLIITSALALAIIGGVTNAQAQEKKKKELTEEQRAIMKEMVGKYDKNGNKKLDPEEREAMSPEDKDKMKKAGIGGGKKKDK